MELEISIRFFVYDMGLEKRYYQPHEFIELKNIALSKGFLLVASSPLTRSSYHADEDFKKLKIARDDEIICRAPQ